MTFKLPWAINNHIIIRVQFKLASCACTKLPWVLEAFHARFPGFRSSIYSYPKLRPWAEDVSTYGLPRSISPQTLHTWKKTFGTHGSLKLKKYVSLPTATLSNCQMFSPVDIEETVFNRNKYQSLLSLLLLAPRSGLELNDSVGH